MHKVDISKGFEVSDFTFQVKCSKEVDKDLESRGVFGACDNLNSIILIGTHPTDQFRNTFIHECLESIKHHYVVAKLTHEQLTQIANGLAQIFKSLGIEFEYKEEQ